MSDWHEIDAAWDDLGYASAMLLALGETKQWSELVREAAECTHATAEEVWDGMAAAVRRYLESLDGTRRPDGDDGQTAALRELVAALRADLDAAEREIERLRSLDASRYAEATGEYRRKVAELAAEIEKRDKGIARLKRRRGELMGQVRELADECARLRSGLDNDTLGPENVVRAEQAEANDANAAQVGRVTGSGGMGHDAVESVGEPDTREKLEADVTTYLIDNVATWAAHRYALNEEVLRWLDRQASITERDMLDEMQHVFVPDPADITKRDERIAELEAEREQWRAAYGAVMDGIFELQRFGRLMPDETVTGQGDARRMPSDG